VGAPESAVPRLAKQCYYERRAAKLGETDWVDANADTLPALLAALFALHATRWSQQSLPGVLVDNRVQAFHRLAAPELLRARLLRLFGLRINGRLVAVFHGLADGRRLHAYLSGYDPTLPHPGLGAMLLGRAIRTADAEGLGELHFLRGDEPYKYAWGGVDQPLYARSLWK
jgi:CelD/BcsL family acetyltransferase involved in cellulose biosynthesis